MKRPSSTAWSRLTRAARLVQDERDATVPHGFATRIVARAWAAPRSSTSLFEFFSWRALGVAGLLALACLLADISLTSTGNAAGSSFDDVLSGDDTVARLLDQS